MDLGKWTGGLCSAMLLAGLSAGFPGPQAVSSLTVDGQEIKQAGTAREAAGSTSGMKKVPAAAALDTLIITFSHVIEPNQEAGFWDSLLWYYPGGNTASDPVRIVIVGQPSPSRDGLTWTFVIEGAIRDSDLVFLRQAELPGDDSSREGLAFLFREAVIGEWDYLRTFNRFPSFRGPPFRESNYEKLLEHMDIDRWVPPYGMNDDGTIDISTQSSCLSQDNFQVGFPRGCLSSLVLFINEPYTARINIYDNIGEFVHSSTQKFGFCGELQNAERKTEQGLTVSDLIWNQKDLQGNFVGSGVYVWNVRLDFESGKSWQIIKSQGIARSREPGLRCAVGL
ncbi:hypothetical protein ACFL5V_00660 [Fibrobacterota bacterium]